MTPENNTQQPIIVTLSQETIEQWRDGNSRGNVTLNTNKRGNYLVSPSPEGGFILEIAPNARFDEHSAKALSLLFNLPKEKEFSPAQLTQANPAKVINNNGTWTLVEKGNLSEKDLVNTTQTQQSPVSKSQDISFAEITNSNTPSKNVTQVPVNSSAPLNKETVSTEEQVTDPPTAEEKPVSSANANTKQIDLAPDDASVDEIIRELPPLQEAQHQSVSYTYDAHTQKLHLQTPSEIKVYENISPDDFRTILYQPELIFHFKEFSTQPLPKSLIADVQDFMIDLRSLPASLAEENSSAATKLKNSLAKEIDEYTQDAVSKTQDWLQTFKKALSKTVEHSKNWLAALKSAFSEPNVQQKTQQFKDNISTKTVQLGNWIASRPEAIATNNLMKTLYDKFNAAQRTWGDDQFSLGDYQLKAVDKNTFVLSDLDTERTLVAFKVSPGKVGQQLKLMGKDNTLDSAHFLKQIRDSNIVPSEQAKQARDALINNIERRVSQLKPGTNANGLTVRSLRGAELQLPDRTDKFLHNRQGQSVSATTIESFSKDQLEALSNQLDVAYRSQQTQEVAPILAKILKNVNNFNYSNKNYTLNYNPDQKRLTFESKSGEKFVAQSLGNGKWKYIEGDLSDTTFNAITTTVKDKVEKWEKTKQEEFNKAKILATLA
ncbi:hypothetical protein [Gloeothece verrucosa]|uniref:Uncharacterized protein n=1 Tax=Gloeothece verrucosa (strain PCC 7822) TaxID=497965 RepID=E0UM95_GLOV7|nr:hypothetical protein [Gloeothece verrucosa]ADN18075.1 hypothetical protein Cyan7822_6275 [Gloeothece verrucosa PCC 7822]